VADYGTVTQTSVDLILQYRLDLTGFWRRGGTCSRNFFSLVMARTSSASTPKVANEYFDNNRLAPDSIIESPAPSLSTPASLVNEAESL